MFSDSVLLFRLSLSQFSLTTLQGSVCTRVWVKWMVSNRVVKHSSLRPRAKFEGHFLATLNVTDIVNTCLTVGFDCFLSEKPPSPLNWRVVVTNRWNVSSHFQLLGVFYCVSHVPCQGDRAPASQNVLGPPTYMYPVWETKCCVVIKLDVKKILQDRSRRDTPRGGLLIILQDKTRQDKTPSALVTRMLTRDLFAVANFLVLYFLILTKDFCTLEGMPILYSRTTSCTSKPLICSFVRNANENRRKIAKSHFKKANAEEGRLCAAW